MHKKRKKYFDRHLYIENIRQLKGIGVLFLILFMGILAVQSGMDISKSKLDTAYREITLPYIFISVYLIITPILTLFAFHWLTKRNACDFYHAIPHRRQCIFLCGILSVLTYIIAAVFLGSLLYSAIHTFSSGYYLELKYYLKDTVGILVASLLVLASVSLACTLSGTLLTNIVVSGFIILVPRCIWNIMALVISNNFFIADIERSCPVLGKEYNLVMGLKYNDIRVEGILYTLLFALLYLIVAGIVFYKRDSETAQSSANNGMLQAVYRTLAAFCVSLLFVYVYLKNYIKKVAAGNSYRPSMKELVIYISLVLLVVVVYYVYEILTVKQGSNLIKKCPGIFLLLALDVVMIFSVGIIARHYLNFKPDPEEISYVKLMANPKYNTDIGMTTYDYHEKMMESVKIDDTEVLQIISDSLKESIRLCPSRQKENTYDILLHINGKDYYRTVYLKDEDKNRFYDILYKMDEYQAIYRSLPDFQDSHLGVKLKYDKGMYKKLYQALMGDLQTADLEQIKSYFLEEDIYMYNDDTGRISNKCIIFSDYSDKGVNTQGIEYYTAKTRVDGKICTYRIPITETFPNAFEEYTGMVNMYALKNGFAQELITNLLNYDYNPILDVSVSQDCENIVGGYFFKSPVGAYRIDENEYVRELCGFMNKIGEDGVRAHSCWLMVKGYADKENVRFFIDIGNQSKAFFELIGKIYELEGNYETASY